MDNESYNTDKQTKKKPFKNHLFCFIVPFAFIEVNGKYKQI